ncbi:hypothetical protein [Mesorhizobium sp. Cs1299R1N3]|uniref:hypothetical protein n=1 Tax=Mesorhizobium sp. Cs1299R1N3 TaxID=3015173 RepID=UPI00301C3607
MTQRELEAVYEAIATEIDRVGAGKSELYLAKLALLLARAIDDRQRVLGCISEASASLA